jgi:hypothetical protein
LKKLTKNLFFKIKLIRFQTRSVLILSDDCIARTSSLIIF